VRHWTKKKKGEALTEEMRVKASILQVLIDQYLLTRVDATA